MKNEKLNFKYKTPFTIIDSAVILSEDLSVYDKTVYSVLCAYSNNKDKTCYPSYQTVAKKSGCSRRKVISVIANLEKLGLIEKEEQFNSSGDNTSNLFTVKTISSAGISPENAPHTPHSNAENSPPNANGSPPNAQCTPKLNLDNLNKNNYIYSSNYHDDRLDKLKNKIEYEYFEENMPDKLPFIDSLLGYIFDLERENKSENIRLIDGIDSCVILEFFEEVKGKSLAGVKNINAYMKKVFIEFLRAREILLATI